MRHLSSVGIGLWLAAALLVAGCAGDNGLPKFAIVPSPDWNASGTAPKPAPGPRAVTDMVSGEAQCAALEPTAASAGAEPAATPTPLPGTAALGMNECEVVRRVGQPLRVEIGSDDRAERTVVITYLQGARPGIYRFRAGRLVSIERAPEQPASKPDKKPKKPAKSKERAAAGT